MIKLYVNIRINKYIKIELEVYVRKVELNGVK